jgi:hypothetical protein
MAMPSWITEPPEIEPGWLYHAPYMANKYYRPARLAYRRGQYGDDVRLKYLLYFVDVRGQRVLELGAQEGHHSIILEKLGVRELVSVEARPENIAKCNIIKQRYHLDNTTFVQQNVESLYNATEPAKFSPPFDLIFCCGTLYHLPNPAKALEWMHTQAPALFLGTHYYEPGSPESYPPGMFRWATLTHKDKSYQGLALGEDITHLGSGMSELSYWPTESDLVQMLNNAGYTKVSVLGKEIQNIRPHITILAES